MFYSRGDFKGVHRLQLNMDLPERLSSQLAGEEGPTRQKAARLVVDLAVTAGAQGFVNVDHAHVSGVSVITGGHGLRRFLSDFGALKNMTPVVEGNVYDPFESACRTVQSA